MVFTLGRNLRSLSPRQRHAFFASFLGWSLDAFDFFILTFCVSAIATSFRVGVEDVAEGLFWTLAMRPVGALIFGAMAERWGRRPTLMLNVVSFSVFELASAFAPTFTWLLVFRAMFGIAMGGEWGVGAALAFETLPEEGRGFFSGLLQEGYVVGNLLAAAVYWIVFPHLHGTGIWANWRVMFMIGALPAVLAMYIRSGVHESPAWLQGKAAKRERMRMADLRRYLPSFLFLVVLMSAFTALSHGTQDLYPTFLQKGRHFAPASVGKIAMVANVGGLLGGIVFGSLSERWGRRRAIIAAALLAVPLIPLWTGTHTFLLIAVGGFLMQFMVQGAWGVIPAHLNELSPSAVRATFPGFAYQLGNLLTSRNARFQAVLARRFYGGALGPVMGWTVLLVAVLVALFTGLGGEAKGARMALADQQIAASGE